MHINMINEVMSCRSSVTENLKVGMCATMFCGSDRYAMVVTEVLSPKKIRVAHMMDEDYDNLKRVDENGHEFLDRTTMRKYVAVSEDDTTIIPIGTVYSYRKNKRWIAEGCGLWETGAVHLGNADNYRDPSF